MKLTLSKQRFVLMVVLFLILLCGGVYLLIKDSKSELMSERVNKYGELVDFCEIKKQTEENLYFDCYAFLESEATDEEGMDCIAFVTPYYDEEGTRLDMLICEEKEKIFWENPYSNYSLHIPVVMTLKYEKTPFQFYKFVDLTIELLEDEKAYELWELVDLLGPMHYKAFRYSGHKLTEELGYSITAEGDLNDEENFVPNGLVIYSAKIRFYQVEGDKISLEMEAFLDEQDKTLTFTTEGFTLFENAGEGEGVLINASNIADVDLDTKYQAYFKFREKGPVSEGFVEEQFALLTEGNESDLLFDMIVVVHEE